MEELKVAEMAGLKLSHCGRGADDTDVCGDAFLAVRADVFLMPCNVCGRAVGLVRRLVMV